MQKSEILCEVAAAFWRCQATTAAYTGARHGRFAFASLSMPATTFLGSMWMREAFLRAGGENVSGSFFAESNRSFPVKRAPTCKDKIEPASLVIPGTLGWLEKDPRPMKIAKLPRRRKKQGQVLLAAWILFHPCLLLMFFLGCCILD